MEGFGGYGLLQLLVGVSVLVVRPVGVFGVLVLMAVWFGGFVWVSFVVRRSLVHHRGTPVRSSGPTPVPFSEATGQAG